MSVFQPALDFVLNNEDSQRKYEIVGDVGGEAIAGINSHSFPDQFSAIAKLPQIQRGPAVARFYSSFFFMPLNLAAINSQDLVNRVMDESVNGGLRTGACMLQRVANSLGASPQLVVDGGIGPATAAAVNALDSAQLVTAYKAARVTLYKAIAQAHPEDAEYVDQWIARANK